MLVVWGAKGNVCTGRTCCVKHTVSCLCTCPFLGIKQLSDQFRTTDQDVVHYNSTWGLLIASFTNQWMFFQGHIPFPMFQSCPDTFGPRPPVHSKLAYNPSPLGFRRAYVLTPSSLLQAHKDAQHTCVCTENTKTSIHSQQQLHAQTSAHCSKAKGCSTASAQMDSSTALPLHFHPSTFVQPMIQPSTLPC